MPRRRILWIGVGVVAMVAVLGLAFLLGTALARPSANTTTAAPSPTPVGVPSPSPSPTAEQDRAQYRAYVSAAIRGGASVVASLAGLEGCRDSRPQCVSSLNQASEEVSDMQHQLLANPPPSCLADANGRLMDALSFQQQGLELAEEAVRSENRIQLAQGLLLTTAGAWRGGQALADIRRSDC
jgi:hypothetical protein